MVGRTKVNVTLLRVILKESGVDPDKVEVAQFSNDQIADMVKDATIDAFMLVGPVDSKITSEAITATARAPRRAGLPADRRLRGDRRASSAI